MVHAGRPDDGSGGRWDRPACDGLEGRHFVENAGRERGARGPNRALFRATEEGRLAVERWLSEPDAFILIAELDGQPVGYAMVHLRAGSPTWPSSERAGEVETLSVHPSARGRGVGSALLRAVSGELAALGVGELALHVVSGNSRARGFYERHGLRPFALWLGGPLIGDHEAKSATESPG